MLIYILIFLILKIKNENNCLELNLNSPIDINYPL